MTPPRLGEPDQGQEALLQGGTRADLVQRARGQHPALRHHGQLVAQTPTSSITWLDITTVPPPRA